MVEDCLEVALSAQLEIEQIDMEEEEVRTMIMWVVKMAFVVLLRSLPSGCLFLGDGEHSRRVQGCGSLPLLYRSQVPHFDHDPHYQCCGSLPLLHRSKIQCQFLKLKTQLPHLLFLLCVSNQPNLIHKPENINYPPHQKYQQHLRL